jgi:uncharacterized protein (DUF1499 family)
MRSMLVWVLAALVLGFLGLAGYVRLAGDDTGLWHADPVTAPPTGNPNSWRVGPEDEGQPVDAPAPVFAIGAADLAAAIDAVALAEPRTVRLAGQPEDLWVTYVQRSRFMAFPDYVSVRVIPLGPERSTIAIYSRARYGQSDLGVNRARVEKWLAALAEHAA